MPLKNSFVDKVQHLLLEANTDLLFLAKSAFVFVVFIGGVGPLCRVNWATINQNFSPLKSIPTCKIPPNQFVFCPASMGNCTSKDEKDQKKLNRRIDEQIRKDQSMQLRVIKLLLLGKLFCSQSLIDFLCFRRRRIRQINDFETDEDFTLEWVWEEWSGANKAGCLFQLYS